MVCRLCVPGYGCPGVSSGRSFCHSLVGCKCTCASSLNGIVGLRLRRSSVGAGLLGRVLGRSVVPMEPDVAGGVVGIAESMRRAWPGLPSSGHPHLLRMRCRRGFASRLLAHLVSCGLHLEAVHDQGRETLLSG